MLDDEQLVIELINRARANPAAEAARLGIDLNQGLPAGTVSTSPKQPLAPHQLLIDTAAAHSQDMIDRNFFGHVNPDGDDQGDRLDKAGYPWLSCGENLALHLDPLQAHDALFQSPGHRANLLRDSFREVGVGVAVRPAYGINMTELFAKRSDDVFLTGVAFSDQIDGDNFFSPGEGLGGVAITATARNRGTVYTTTTGPSGGYSLQVPAGTYDLTAVDGELKHPIDVSGVVVGTQNAKIDFVAPLVVLPPVAGDDRAMTQKDAPVVIEVLANDAPGVALDVTSVTIVSQPRDGQAVVEQATGQIHYTPGTGLIGADQFTYQVRDRNGVWSSAAHVFVAVVDLSDRPWRNPRNPLDVDADQLVTAADVLIVINDLNLNWAHSLSPPSPQDAFPTPYLDVTGDTQVSPQDVLAIVNFLNSSAAGEGEASFPAAVTHVAPAASLVALSAPPPPTLGGPRVPRAPSAGQSWNPALPPGSGLSRASANSSSNKPFVAVLSLLRVGDLEPWADDLMWTET